MNKNEKFHGALDAKAVSDDHMNDISGGIGDARYGCPKCGALIAKEDYPAHKAICPFNNLPEPTIPDIPAGQTCPRCGRVLSATGYALHVLECSGIG